MRHNIDAQEVVAFLLMVGVLLIVILVMGVFITPEPPQTFNGAPAKALPAVVTK